jgi:hypothetical protein
MGIGRRPTDDKKEVIANAKILRVICLRFNFMRAISTINDISTHAKYPRFELAKDTFSNLE